MHIDTVIPCGHCARGRGHRDRNAFALWCAWPSLGPVLGLHFEQATPTGNQRANQIPASRLQLSIQPPTLGWWAPLGSPYMGTSNPSNSDPKNPHRLWPDATFLFSDPKHRFKLRFRHLFLRHGFPAATVLCTAHHSSRPRPGFWEGGR